MTFHYHYVLQHPTSTILKFLSNSTIIEEGYWESLTADIKVNSILGVFNPEHDLATISASITGTQLHNCERGVTDNFRVAGY